MVWFRVDDSFGDHPKVEQLISGRSSDAAIALWTLAGAWCAKHLTDGRIPAARVPRLGVKSHAKAAAELVRVGLWVTTADGFAFHQWAERQPSRVAVEGKREAGAARQERYRRAHETRDESVSNAVTSASVTPLPVPVPSQTNSQEREDGALSAIELDSPPRTAPPSREPASVVRRLFAAAYEATRKTIWPHAAHAREIEALATWADQQARADGVDVEHVVGRVIASACADAYLVGADLPLRLIVKQAGALYRPPPRAATGPPAVVDARMVATWREKIREVKREDPTNAARIAELEQRIKDEYANPTGVPETAPARSRASH